MDKQDWGDIEEAETDMTGTKVFETQPDEHGVRLKTVIEYSTNSEGKTVKTTKNYKLYKKVTRINKRVQERKKLKKFGDCRPGEQGITLLSNDKINIETPGKKKKDKEEEALKASEMAEAGIKETWKTRAQRLGADSWDTITAKAATPGGSEAAADTPSNVYVPRSLRGGPGGAPGAQSRDDSTTVRVTNLSEDTREDDLRELCRRFGPIQRVFLAKDRHSGLSRGFAFVTFVYREDGAKAIEALNGFGYDHLVLAVEWAKPSGPGF
ncbi:Eukaryotic translation initiation factor 3 subunit [Acanthamoeba castellanii str. Neff]|jgi:translation initiation factor 3 subunit G|uniref:Eukaryotic translation initiation factor 3 subunit G n=1 Tax=Acanthamoeba castellanii (strain ATCC 30010 / Neff) TaxID=1257118 RepID=L8HEF2_ACACF|nr:Eukaryotic translation initiation factor 3 subunit [Acanthamoeba castellanii str. Neff]ELR23587.1 Eukaryotic translation initiation factor 3 subunit [Acanthamoeba castellanii str. Neff]